MSLNTSHANGGVLIFGGERILIYYNGVEFNLDAQPPNAAIKGSHKGRVYLTTHRVIFNSASPKDNCQSFSMPFCVMKEIDVGQPIFGANYINGIVKAETHGNWEGSGKFKLSFFKGGAIEFAEALMMAAKMSQQHGTYQPPPQQPPPQYYAAPPPAYAPPPYGWIPTGGVFAEKPPANSVFQYQQSPPYPDPSAPSAPPMTAYYDQQNPGTAYVPPPPTYENAMNVEKDKKNA